MSPLVLALSLLFTLCGIACIVISVLTMQIATDVQNESDAFLLESWLGLKPDYLQITFLTNSSNAAFCTEDIHNFYVYNITNYESVRTGPGVLPEFAEIGYNYTRKKCVFDLSYGTYGKGLISVFTPLDPSTANNTIPNSDAHKEVSGSQYYGPWELVGSTGDVDAPLTVLNEQYIKFTQSFAFGGGLDYDSTVAPESMLGSVLISSVLSTLPDTEVQQLMDNVSLGITVEHLRWLYQGDATDNYPVLIDPYYGTTAKLTDPLQLAYFGLFVSWLDSGVDYYREYAEYFLGDVYLLTPDEGKLVHQFTALVSAEKVEKVVQEWIEDEEAGSGVVITRTIDELHHSGRDALFENVDTSTTTLLPTREHGGQGSLYTLARANDQSDRDSAEAFFDDFADIRVYDVRGWYEAERDDVFDNGTITTTDDGMYHINGGPTRYGILNLTANNTNANLYPPGWTDNEDNEYTFSVDDAEAGDFEMSFSMLELTQYVLIPFNYESRVDVDGLELGLFHDEPSYWGGARRSGRQTRPGLIEYGANKYFAQVAFARRDFLGATDLVNSTIHMVDTGYEGMSLYFEPQTGLLTGLNVAPAHVMTVLEYNYFPNYYFPAGYYPYYAGTERHDTYRGAVGPCGKARHNIQVLDTTNCDTLATSQAAVSTVLDSLIFVAVIGAVYIIFAIIVFFL